MYGTKEKQFNTFDMILFMYTVPHQNKDGSIFVIEDRVEQKYKRLSPMNKVLMISNNRTREMGGGPEKETNKELLRERGWKVEIGYVSNTSIFGILTEIPNLVSQVRSEDIDIIVSHCSPPQLHALGYALKKITGKPWLAEFRDPLATNPDVEPGSISHLQRRILEKSIVNSSDQIAWWEGIQIENDYFSQKYTEINKSKFYKIPHLGCGGVNFGKFDNRNTEPYDEFTITYAGSFYDGWIEPYRFLEGVREYVDNRSKDGLRVQFYGDWKDKYQQKVVKEGLEDIVTAYDPIPHDEIISVLKRSHLLLYIGGDNIRNKNNISLKMADYVAARSPILGIVDPSFRAGKFIEKEKVGVTAHPEDAKSVANAIDTVRSGRFEYDPTDGLEHRFDSEAAMDEYAAILDSVSEGEYYATEERE